MLKPGDFVEAEIEMVVFPADAKAYYGPNHYFREMVARDADTWRLVHHETAGNTLQVQAQHGTITRAFPLVLEAGSGQQIQATIEGGSGWLPVTFAGLNHHRDYELIVNGQPFSQAIHGNDFWQTDYDTATLSWSQIYNLPREGSTPLKLEFRRKVQ